MLRSKIAGIALLCASATLALTVASSAEAAPRSTAAGLSSANEKVTDISARRRHRVARYKIRHHRRVARAASYAAHEDCNVLFPCIGVQPSARGLRIERKMAFGKARNRYTPRSSLGAPSISVGYSTSRLVDIARSQIGNGAIYGRSNLWCARFMNYVVQRAGYRGTGSDMASSFASYGTRVYSPQVGAIAVMSRGRRGGHVGVVSGIDANGNPIIISGNHGRRVAEAPYSRRRIYAYVIPTS